jgi:transposase
LTVWELIEGGYDVPDGSDTTKGRQSRRRFEDEFKAQAVRLVLDDGKSIAAVAGDLDLTPSLLGRWVSPPQADGTKGRTGLTTAERESSATASPHGVINDRVLPHENTVHTCSGGVLDRVLLEPWRDLLAGSRNYPELRGSKLLIRVVDQTGFEPVTS